MLNALHTDNSPFSEPQLRDLQRSIGALSHGQAQWLSGYLAGRLSDMASHAAPSPAAQTALTVIFGSETGNGERIATQLVSRLAEAGIAGQPVSMANLRPAALRKLEHAAFVISTHGEGDPPEEALELFELLRSERAPRLEKLKYRILALGDRSYPQFCEAGRELDRLLSGLGATAVAERIEADVDWNAPATEFTEAVLDDVAQQHDGAPATGRAPALRLVSDHPAASREHPAKAIVERVQPITGIGSVKDIRHLELSFESRSLEFQPGDALGVWAPNHPQTVAELLDSLDLDGDSSVELGSDRLALREALRSRLEITRLSPDVLERYAAHDPASGLAETLSAMDREAQAEYYRARQLADLVREYPARIDAAALAALLRPLSPRSYSIASSPDFAEGEIHLTVATLHSDALGVPRTGVASHHLNHGLAPGDPVRVFVEPNTRFRLPDDPQAPIIMIAAGTGIAPFRAFMQHREHHGITADAWLIFGNPHFRTDFLYQREWLAWRNNGSLSRIDVAFSRDQADKRYVQHAVAEQAARIEEWLAGGAFLYLCGSLDMGKAVLDSLVAAIARQRGIDRQEAANVLAALRRSRRIQKDLY